MSRPPESRLPTLGEAVTKGAVGFAVASLCVFATVAFAERWMYTQLGEVGAYLAWTVLFILIGGAMLGGLVIDRWRLPRFYILFGGAFLAYAVAWVAAYFTLRGTTGELLGSILGSFFMAVVFAAGFNRINAIALFAAILFVANSVGYFVGSALNNLIVGRPGMLVWGIVYGVFLGAGIGGVLQLAQARTVEGGRFV